VENYSPEYSPPLLSEYDQDQNHNEDKKHNGLTDQNNDPGFERQRPQSVKEGLGLGRRLVHVDLHLTPAL
jgi:hypothetical protein